MSKEANVDFIGHNQYQGDLAGELMGNARLDIGAYRPWMDKKGRSFMTIYTGGPVNKASSYMVMPLQANAGTLRQYEWKQLDDAIIPVAESRLVGIKDLESRGLVLPLGNAMGTTVLESHTVSDAMEAELTMDGISKSKNDRPVFGTVYLPIPIIHVDYTINARVLEASRSLGNPLDTTMAERAARKVAEKLEAMLFTDTKYTFGGGVIESYVNKTGKNAYTISEAWTTSTKTGAEIIRDVLAMKQMNIDDHFYGPYVMYVPTSVETVLDGDYDATTPGTTIRERILKISNIQDIKVIDTLTEKTILMVQMTSDVVRLVKGMGIQNIQSKSQGNFVNDYKVVTIQVPQIRSDYNGKVGICVGAWA